MLFQLFSSHTWRIASCSAQSAVSITRVAQGLVALTSRTWSRSMGQLRGASVRATS